jgi:hypothetical protein
MSQAQVLLAGGEVVLNAQPTQAAEPTADL